MIRPVLVMASCVVCYGAAAWNAAWAEEPPTGKNAPQVNAQSAVNVAGQVSSPEKLRRALGEPATLEFVDAPLRDCIEYLKDAHSVEIQLDLKAFRDEGVEVDTPVTMQLRRIKLDDTLSILLRPLGLVHLVKHDVLWITTERAAKHAVGVRLYDCSWAGDRVASVVEVLTLVNRLALPEEDVAAAAEAFKIAPLDKLLAVRANDLQHDIIERLLIDLRHAQTTPASTQPAAAAK